MKADCIWNVFLGVKSGSKCQTLPKNRPTVVVFANSSLDTEEEQQFPITKCEVGEISNGVRTLQILRDGFDSRLGIDRI